MCVSTHISFRVGKANDSAALAPRATAPGMEPLGSQALIDLTATGSQVAIDDKVHGKGTGSVKMTKCWEPAHTVWGGYPGAKNPSSAVPIIFSQRSIASIVGGVSQVNP